MCYLMAYSVEKVCQLNPQEEFVLDTRYLKKLKVSIKFNNFYEYSYKIYIFIIIYELFLIEFL